jgi:hypothetical protein
MRALFLSHADVDTEAVRALNARILATRGPAFLRPGTAQAAIAAVSNSVLAGEARDDLTALVVDVQAATADEPQAT